MTKGCGPLGLDEASHIDTRHSDGQGQLDDELIAGGVTAVDRDRPPTLDLVATLVGQPIGDPALIVRPAGALDQPVTLEPRQGRVDLPGQVPPVRDSNSLRSCAPYIGSCASKANKPRRIDIRCLLCGIFDTEYYLCSRDGIPSI